MAKKFIFVLGLVFLPITVMAEQLLLRSGAPDQYVVKKGDTLWDISGMYLEAPWLWPDLWEINPSIDDPHKIYPDDLISLVFVDGSPKLRIPEEAPKSTKLSPEAREKPSCVGDPPYSNQRHCGLGPPNASGERGSV